MPKMRIKRWFSREWQDITPEEVFRPDDPLCEGRIESLESRVDSLERLCARLLAQLYCDRYITLEEGLAIANSRIMDEVVDDDPPTEEEEEDDE